MKKDHDTLIEKIEVIKKTIYLNTTWEHYKGGVYKVIGYAISTNDDEVCVLYQSVDIDPFYESPTFCRPANEWLDIISVTVGDGSVPDDRVPRFTQVRKVEIWKEVSPR